MKIEVEFCKSETAILEAAFEQHRDELREHWAVDTMADMVKLLAMHGLDSLEGLAGLGDTCTLIVDMRPCSGMDGCRVHHFE